jgi:hypothetical protein
VVEEQEVLGVELNRSESGCDRSSATTLLFLPLHRRLAGFFVLSQSVRSMTRITVAVAILAALAMPAVAQSLPLPKTGSCPSGYASEAGY